MPRTKQNHPKNLKDKIEEAQKELKDPKGCQRGVTENSRRSADSIKGLKRKKVVAESQLKKIPKSPVKKPSQARTPAAKEATPSCSFAASPSRSKPVQNGEPGDDDDARSPPSPSDGQPVRAEATPTPAGRERPMQTERGAARQQRSFEPRDEEGGPARGPEGSLKDDWGGSANSDSTGAPHSAAPLEVLLKAMEPDLCTLAERKSSFPVTHGRTAGPTAAAQASAAMSAAVNVGVPAQLTLTAPDFASKQQQYYQSVSQTVPLGGLAAGQAAPVQYQPSQAYPPGRMQELAHTAALQREKQGLRPSYSAMPASTLTHAPAPSGPKVLPQSQPAVQTCQSVSASVPSAIQVPVTPGFHQVQMATIVTPGLEQVCGSSAKDQKSKKQGKYVCEYCSRACAKPSVLLKHIRSHTGERPYPCVTCGFSFKTKSNLYKHKKSHAHAIKLGLVVRADSGGGNLSQESDRTPSVHSDAEESGESEDESAADLDPESSQSSAAGLSESSMQSAGAAHACQGEAEPPAALETIKANQKTLEPKVTLPKVVVYSVNVSPLRADSPRVTDSTPELAQAQRQREPQASSVRSSVTVLSSLTEVDCPSPLQDAISEDEDRHCKSPPSGGHALLQRQEATDFSQLQRQQATDVYQQQQGKGLLSPRSLGSTDSGYFSRSESADQAMSPPSPFVKITPPTDMDVSKNPLISHSAVVATVMHATYAEKPPALQGQMRPPLETKTLSLEERISKLISDNEAVVDDKQLDSVKPRRTSLSRRGSIDSPKSYIFKDSFQFDLKPMGRRSSSSSDIPKSPFTPTDKSKQVFLLSVPPQYPSMDCLPITRSNSMPTTPGFSALPPHITPQPHVLRGCQSFDDKIGSLSDDVFISAPSTPNPAAHSRTLVRQIAIEDFSTSDGHGLSSTRSMDEGRLGPSMSTEVMQKSKSFEHGPEINRRPQQSKGTMFECETCRNRYRKLENFENHKKFYCSELHGPKNKPAAAVREVDQDVFVRGTQQPQSFNQRNVGSTGVADQQTSIRKRRKMKSVGDDDDQSPTEPSPPCSGSFDSCQLSKDIRARAFPQASILVELQPNSGLPQIPPIQLMGRSTESSESRLSPIREAQISVTAKERGDLQRQGSGTSVIRHTNSLSRPSSFETSESIDRSSPVDFVEKEAQSITKTATATTVNITKESHPELAPLQKCKDREMPGKDHHANRTTAVPSDIRSPPQQSRLVRQNNIQVPEILVTEEPDREQESQGTEPEKPPETFSWPQRSESLSKLPTEKLPPKKKRIRLAEMEHSSGESSFESTLSRSLSRDSSLSRCSSVSASFDRDELPRADSPSRAECTSRSPEIQNLPLGCNTLGVPGLRDSREMRRASSEQISCTQPSVEIASGYRSKSFDCGSVSPSRSISPMETGLQKSSPAVPVAQIPLIERRRGPLVRQMSLKIGFENQLQPGKPPVALQKVNTANTVLAPQQRFHSTGLPNIGQPLILHQLSSGEAVQQKNEVTVQSINLGSQTQQAPVHGLPHPWHQSSKTLMCQRKPQAPGKTVAGQQDAQNTSADSQDKRNYVPKYQLQCPAPKASAYASSTTIGTQITLPIITLPVVKEGSSVSNPTGGIQNICVVPQSHQIVANSAASIVLPVGLQSRAGMAPLPQILITHELNPPSSVAPCSRPPPPHVTDSSIKNPHVHGEDPQVPAVSQPKSGSGPDGQNRAGDSRSMPSLGSLHCVQKMSSMGLCPQQEPAASSKRMLSPANSLDIAMEKQQKRAKDEHGAACLTDGRSLSYLNSKMAEVTRQRKLTLVRQVCTTEPVDSPIDLEAPQQHPEKAEVGKLDTVDTQTPDSSKNRVNAPTGQTAESKTAAVEDYPDPSGRASSPVPPNCTLKSLGKSEEGRSTSKSPVRTANLHGQGKLTSSVSVVNTRDSHRLSFPSLKTATTLTWCYLMKRKPLHTPQTDQKVSAYSTWSISKNNPNPLGLPTKVVMSLFNSKQIAKKTHYTQAITTSLKSDILSYSSKLKDSLPKVLTPQTCKSNDKCKLKPESQQSNESDRDSSSSKSEPRRVKIFDGGYKSNEEYVYVRGRGRGKYICEECGIRCKKPSMLRKHIRTHSDVRPYHCTHCNFSFKTKGNLTKHMKSKAHSKKCMEMGVSLSSVDDQDIEDAGERSQTGSTDRPGSDGEDSDGVEDEDNDVEDEDEEDSQAESGLSATPSVSASPQHLPAVPLDALPSALLAQMSISGASPGPAPLSLPPPPPSDSQASDTESVAMMSPVSVASPSPAYLSFPALPVAMVSGGPAPLSFAAPPAAADSHSSDTESVTMMSPVSPCRQMSIDYPDVDSPTTPPAPGKGPKDTLSSPPPRPWAGSSEVGFPVDRSTQTTLLPPMAYDPPGSLRFLPQAQIADLGVGVGAGPGPGAHTHLFSHLPLHSQQPLRSPYSMVPVGGIQLVPAGLAAYSTFLPVQAGPMQLTIPAVSVLHRSGSPLPAASPDAPPPAATAEPVGGVLPCFPLGQVGVAGPLGLEALGVVGVANAALPSAQLLPQPGLALKTLGLQVLAASPASQGGASPQAHMPGLQILNIALPTLIPSLSPIPAAPVAPVAPAALPCHTETPASCPSAAPSAATPPQLAPTAATPPQIAPTAATPPQPAPTAATPPQLAQTSATPPQLAPTAATPPQLAPPAATPPQPAPAVQVAREVTSYSSPSPAAAALGHGAGGAEREEVTSPPRPSASPAGGAGEREPQKRQSFARRQVTVDYNDASSDDEDRLVIAT
ncbi:zinc finger protein 40 [Anguilla rostrata]|uniref:zinc finger protein 40 n=1 Tax=Anguilla rostrata TaxID=7938 RepID=UPI0030D0A695